MKNSYLRRAATLTALTAIAAITVSATRPPMKGVSYRLRMTTRLPAMMQQLQNGNAAVPPVIVKVKASGKNARFEFDSMPQGMAMPPGDYMLFLESGRT